VLAKRIQHLAGDSPMQYLARWRRPLASIPRVSSNPALATIAQEVS